MKKQRPHQRTTHKKKLFIEGFTLLRRLAQGELTRDEAGRELKIPYREWYRWLRIYDECNIPIAVDYRYRKDRQNEKTYRLWPEDWARLITGEKGNGRREMKDSETVKALLRQADEHLKNLKRVCVEVERARNKERGSHHGKDL